MIRKTMCVAALVASAPCAHAVDGGSFEIGVGNENTETVRVGVHWNWGRRWLEEHSWTLGGYWDLQVGRWSGPLHPGRAEQNVWDTSITPVFRLERGTRTRVWPFFEAAIGFHLLSDLNINSERSFSSHFQFGDHIAAGVRFGEGHRYEMSLRLQHLSNGGITSPNPGINFLQLRLAYHPL
jgi:lipid A 3-O-deacylase